MGMAMAPLSDAERAQIAATIAQVKEQIPELAEDIKALREAGFDIGWRNVVYVGAHRDEPGRAVHVGQMVLESNEQLKARMANGNHR